MRSAIPLYDAIAPEYTKAFDAPHRKAYDLLAWEYVCNLLPAQPGKVIDAGCGTGRWAERILSRGHRLTGIEPSAEMIKALELGTYGPAFVLIPEEMETASVERDAADLVLAMGSLQYTRDPATVIQRFASWVKPGGYICVLVDSFVGLVLELLLSGKEGEALERLKTQRGVWKQKGHEADLHLLDRRTLQSHFAAAGLTDFVSKALLVSASALGLEKCKEAIELDETRFLQLERQLSAYEMLADAGKHLIVSGRRPKTL